jgi:glucose-1-phosphate thymidylyltransferase
MIKSMKGIVLAGGSGTRLHPTTISVNKHLLMVYDKPMIYYPVSILLLAGIKDILIITTPNDSSLYKNLLGDGSHLGVNFQYSVQEKPNGLAEAFIIGKNFIGDDDVALILGDNIFYGSNFKNILFNTIQKLKSDQKAQIFGYKVHDPERYGVVEFNSTNEVISIVEKPTKPKSKYAVVGLYFYPNNVVNVAKSIKPSDRGELEITSVNEYYLNNNSLNVNLLDEGFSWLDTGTPESILDASNLIRTIEKRQGLKISCLEEIAFKNNLIGKDKIRDQVKKFSKSSYGTYLGKILDN